MEQEGSQQGFSLIRWCSKQLHPPSLLMWFEIPEMTKQQQKAIQGIYPHLCWWESVNPAIPMVSSPSV